MGLPWGFSTAQVAPTATIVTDPVSLTTATAAIGVVNIGPSIAPVYITDPAVSPISTSAGTLWSLAAYTTSTGTDITAILGIARLYNATTDAVIAGDKVVASFPVGVFATTTAVTTSLGPSRGDHHQTFGPRGMAFSNVCSIDVATDSTGTTALANIKITAMYSVP